jgi:hypothetical protein
VEVLLPLPRQVVPPPLVGTLAEQRRRRRKRKRVRSMRHSHALHTYH